MISSIDKITLIGSRYKSVISICSNDVQSLINYACNTLAKSKFLKQRCIK